MEWYGDDYDDYDEYDEYWQDNGVPDWHECGGGSPEWRGSRDWYEDDYGPFRYHEPWEIQRHSWNNHHQSTTSMAWPGSAKGGGKDSNCKLYVANLPEDITDDALRYVFSTYGHVDSCYIMNRTVKYGAVAAFVEFRNARQADDAMRALNEKYEIRKGYGPIVVKHATSKVWQTPSQHEWLGPSASPASRNDWADARAQQKGYSWGKGRGSSHKGPPSRTW